MDTIRDAPVEDFVEGRSTYWAVEKWSPRLILLFGQTLFALAAAFIVLAFIPNTLTSVGFPFRGLAIAILLSVSLWLVDNARRRSSVDAREVMVKDARKPVLLLRGFTQERQRQWLLAALRFWDGFMGVGLRWLYSREELLADAMREIGPFVCLGRPGEKHPPLGAARMYVPDNLWRTTVEELMCKARFVYFVLGKTPSLRWELELAFETLDPRQVIIELPRTAKPYASFLSWAKDTLPVQMPRRFPVRVRPLAGQRGVLLFSEDWRPHFHTDIKAVFESNGLVGPREFEGGRVPRWAVGMFVVLATLGYLATRSP